MAAGWGLAFGGGLARLGFLFKQLQGVDFGEAWVGSAVVYGPFQEFGTKLLQERPHWRVAIPEIVAEMGGNEKAEEQILGGLIASSNITSRELQGFGNVSAGDTAPLIIALMIERRVKELITSKGIIDTGNYKGSIASGRSEQETFDKSAARATNPDSIASQTA
jgi:hypothetical protein